MKIIVQSKKTEIRPKVSIIAVSESFPSDNFDGLLNSTKTITVAFETIVVTRRIKDVLDVEQYLAKFVALIPNSVRVSVVLVDSTRDKGPSYRRNIGAALAVSVNFLFVDDDAVIADDVGLLLEYMNKESCQGAQPLLLKLGDNSVVDSAGDFVRIDKLGIYHPFPRGARQHIQNVASDLYIEEAPSMRSAFMMVERDAFRAVGGFDQTFDFNFEDTDLGWRLTLAGYTLLFVPTVRAYHKGGRTTDPAMHYDKVHRLYLLNFYVLQLKVAKHYFWPLILAIFAVKTTLHESVGLLGGRADVLTSAKNFFNMNRLFVERFRQALIHRRLLEEKFDIRGRDKFEEMARGKRFFRS